jgi:hypothetical protein
MIETQEYKTHLKNLTHKFNLPFELLDKQIKQESRFNPFAISRVGAKGIAQFMPKTWAYCFTEINKKKIWKELLIEDPQDNPYHWRTALSCYIYHMFVQIPRQLKKNKHSITYENILRGYNAGVGNLLVSHKFKETNDYIEIIFEGIENLKLQSPDFINIG